MCKWGTDVVLPLVIPADHSHTGEARLKMVSVDACIAPIVKALNDAGVPTVASCCGHGHRPGSIALADGREILLMGSFEEARRLDHLWPDIGGTPSEEGGECLQGLLDRLDALAEKERGEGWEAEVDMIETERAFVIALRRELDILARMVSAPSEEES